MVGADQLLVPELLFRFHFFRRHVFYFQSAHGFGRLQLRPAFAHVGFELFLHQAEAAAFGSKISMVGIFFAGTQVLQQVAQMALPLRRARPFHSFDEGAVEKFQRVFGKVVVNAVRVRRLIQVRPGTVSVMVGRDPFLNGEVGHPLLARHAGKG